MAQSGRTTVQGKENLSTLALTGSPGAVAATAGRPATAADAAQRSSPSTLHTLNLHHSTNTTAPTKSNSPENPLMKPSNSYGASAPAAANWPASRGTESSGSSRPSGPMASAAPGVQAQVASVVSPGSSARPLERPSTSNDYANLNRKYVKMHLCRKWRADRKCEDKACKDAHGHHQLEPGDWTPLDEALWEDIKSNGLLGVSETSRSPEGTTVLAWFVHATSRKHYTSIMQHGLWTGPSGDGQTDRELVMQGAPMTTYGGLVSGAGHAAKLNLMSFGACADDLRCWAATGSGTRGLNLHRAHVFYVSVNENFRDPHCPLKLTLLFVPEATSEEDRKSLAFAREKFKEIPFSRSMGSLYGRDTVTVGGQKRRVTYIIPLAKSIEREKLEYEWR